MLGALLATAMGATSLQETGKDLVSNCHALQHALPAGQACGSYIEGYIDGRGPEFKYGCFVGLTLSQITSIYLDYMARNPDELKYSKRLGVDSALRLYCISKKK